VPAIYFDYIVTMKLLAGSVEPEEADYAHGQASLYQIQCEA